MRVAAGTVAVELFPPFHHIAATAVFRDQARAFAAPPKNKRSGRAALPGPLAFPFPPSRLLAPAELCARRPGPLVSHLDNSGFIRDRKGSKKSERWFGEVETGVARPRLRCLMRATFAGCCARTASGHAAAPPSSVMNSRRLTRSPRRRGRAASAACPLRRGAAVAA